MNFEPLDFQQLNEADVRAEIIDPLLRRLGYKSSSKNNVIREQLLSLRYPRAFLGRKDSNKDPLLRGKADYICEVEGPIRWVIEAKPPNEIGIDDIEQAYTYANHPEVRAALFCVCNGRKLMIHQTNLGPDAPPLLAIPYADFDSRFNEIENVLSPASVRREFPAHVVDAGRPIGPGLRSIVRITGGHIEYTRNNWNLPMLKNIILAVTGGSIERDENNRIAVIVKTLSPFASVQKLNEKVGLSDIEALSNDDVVSTDPNNLTRVVSARRVTLPEGERVLDLTSWTEQILPFNVIINTETVAEGFLEDHTFKGTFYVKIASLTPQTLRSVDPFEAVGAFELHAA